MHRFKTTGLLFSIYEQDKIAEYFEALNIPTAV